MTESQVEILKAAKCRPDTAVIPRHGNNYELVKKGVDLLIEEERYVGGQQETPYSELASYNKL